MMGGVKKEKVGGLAGGGGRGELAQLNNAAWLNNSSSEYNHQSNLPHMLWTSFQSCGWYLNELNS